MNNCTTYLKKIAILWIMVAIYSIGYAQDHHTLHNQTVNSGESTLETAGTSLTANDMSYNREAVVFLARENAFC